MSELLLAAKLFLSCHSKSDVVYAVYKSPQTLLREQAEEMDRCEGVQQRLEKAIKDCEFKEKK